MMKKVVQDGDQSLLMEIFLINLNLIAYVERKREN